MFKVDFPITIVKHYSITKNKKKDWILEGYAATSDYDLQGDIITKEAISSSENDLLENSTVLYNHDDDRAIGKVIGTKFTPAGLWIKMLISKTAPDIWKQVTEGVLNKFSVSARILKAQKEFVDAIGKVATIITKMLLIEVSLVTVPANTKARALRWYISKGLKTYEKKGGVIPMVSQQAINNAFQGAPAPIGEEMKTDMDGNIINKSGNTAGKARDIPTVPETKAKPLAEAIKADNATAAAKETVETPKEVVQEAEVVVEVEEVEEVKEEVKVESRAEYKAPIKVEKKATPKQDKKEEKKEKEEKVDKKPAVKTPKKKPKKKPVLRSALVAKGIRQAIEALTGVADMLDKSPKKTSVVKSIGNGVQLDSINKIINERVELALAKRSKGLGKPLKRKGLVSNNEPKSATQKILDNVQTINNPEARLKALLTAQRQNV